MKLTLPGESSIYIINIGVVFFVVVEFGFLGEVVGGF